eukprot:COSAG01_NODE_489_length_16370_cov_7.973818_19_plen_58_part_00
MDHGPLDSRTHLGVGSACRLCYPCMGRLSHMVVVYIVHVEYMDYVYGASRVLTLFIL